MNTKQLNFYPKLKSVLGIGYRNELLDIMQKIPRIVRKNMYETYMNIYSLYVSVVTQPSNTTYSALDIRNNKNKLNEHLSALIGFLYSEHVGFSKRDSYTYSIGFIKIFSHFALSHNTTLNNYKLSDRSETPDELVCIKIFSSLGFNKELFSYYSGWHYQDKLGNQRQLHLATIFDSYGEKFTSYIHSGINNFTQTLKRDTARNVVNNLILLMNEFAKHCTTLEKLEHSLKAENSTVFMEGIYNSLLFQVMINGNDVKTFHLQWTAIVSHFTQCFIDTNVFEEPIKPFLIPSFKEPVDNEHCISIGGKLSKKEEDRWLVNMPLEIKDEEVLNLIHEQVNRDLKHIRIISHKLYKEMSNRHKRNMEYINSGQVKPLPQKGLRLQGYPIGINNLDNVIATFYHYGFGVGGVSSKTGFLGFSGEGDLLLKELNLPNISTLNTIVSLLVLEHPKITPAWLQDWELYDKNRNQVGFKQVGKQWVAVSFKNRKGASIAQQEIVLNDYSKSIVMLLIEHTRYVRDKLKEQGGSDWRYMMLKASLNKPERPNDLGHALSHQSVYHKSLIVNSYCVNPQNSPYKNTNKPFSFIYKIHPKVINQVLTKNEAKDLAVIVTPRSIRKARALQIYLETRSLKAVAEALGHKDVDFDMLESYLPKPLMDYFNQRWIRQFQNAIIFEALKESPFLFDALDFDENSLEEFLCNHGLKELPTNLEQVKTCTVNEDNQSIIDNIDELVFTLTTPLFQVLIAIQTMMESASQHDVFKPIVERWHQAAIFILSHFSLDGKATNYRRPDKELIPLYKAALDNPLDVNCFKENLLCH
ncbi:hypothetical protein [Vibrio harveyi]|uniref:hypothetical protein n=1 Tax=Vibrio harveyi TaxID=669 RepID=UPI003BB6B5AF